MLGLPLIYSVITHSQRVKHHPKVCGHADCLLNFSVLTWILDGEICHCLSEAVLLLMRKKPLFPWNLDCVGIFFRHIVNFINCLQRKYVFITNRPHPKGEHGLSSLINFFLIGVLDVSFCHSLSDTIFPIPMSYVGFLLSHVLMSCARFLYPSTHFCRHLFTHSSFVPQLSPPNVSVLGAHVVYPLWVSVILHVHCRPHVNCHLHVTCHLHVYCQS